PTMLTIVAVVTDELCTSTVARMPIDSDANGFEHDRIRVSASPLPIASNVPPSDWTATRKMNSKPMTVSARTTVRTGLVRGAGGRAAGGGARSVGSAGVDAAGSGPRSDGFGPVLGS